MTAASPQTLAGRAWVFGANVSTDALAPGPYIKGPIETLAEHCLESLDPQFAANVAEGDFVIGGANFGMGSSREQAPQALRVLGVRAVLAPSFAGIFYRNALNLGLLALECPEADRIAAGEQLILDLNESRMTKIDAGEHLAFEPVPGHLLEMINDGGLVPHLKKRLAAAKGGR